MRNVPFESKVWLKYIRALEKCDQPIKTIREVFEQAITNNFTEDASRYTDLWIAYIDTYRRKTELYIEDGEGGDKLDEKKVEELRTIFTVRIKPKCLTNSVVIQIEKRTSLTFG